MILRDKVEVLERVIVDYDSRGDPIYDWVAFTTLPAYVGYTTTSLDIEPGRTVLTETLRAIVPPFDFDPTEHRLQWRGTLYRNDGPPSVRRRGASDHHLTIPLLAVTG